MRIMTDLITNIPFAKLGWSLLHVLWISTLYLSGMALVWKMLDNFSARIKYNVGLAALLALPFIPWLLFIEHSGILPPIGLADWNGTSTAETAQEPLIQGLPQITGLQLDPSFYYWLGIIWTIGAAVLLAYHLLTLIAAHIKCRKRPALHNKKIGKLLKQFSDKSDVKTNISVKEAGFTEGPAVAGIIRPVLLLPNSLTDHYTDKELEGLILHELIHIERKDNFFAFLQHLICSVFFFQPLLWWVSRKINREREHICDQEVTAITNDSHTYGNTLVKLQLHTQSAMAHSLNMADKNIVQRIKRLVDTPKNSLDTSQKFRRAGIALLITAITLFCTLWNSYHLHHDHNPHLQEDNREFVTKEIQDER